MRPRRPPGRLRASFPGRRRGSSGRRSSRAQAASRTCSPSTWAGRAPTSRPSSGERRRSRPSRWSRACRSASRWSTCTRSAPAAARSRGSMTAAPCGSGPVLLERVPARPATAWAARRRRSPTRTSSSATWPTGPSSAARSRSTEPWPSSLGGITCGRVVTQTFQPRSQRLGAERHELGRGRKGHRGRRRSRSGRRGRDGAGAPRGQRRARDRSARAGAGRLRRRRAPARLRAGRGSSGWSASSFRWPRECSARWASQRPISGATTSAARSWRWRLGPRGTFPERRRCGWSTRATGASRTN